jgi:hypothetical protein
MTKAAWRVRTSAGRELRLKADAMKKGEMDVLVSSDGFATIEQALSMTPWQKVVVDDVSLETRMLSASVETPTWQVNVTSKPIYGLVQPLVNETHTHGHWALDQKRLDLVIDGNFPQPDAHGIVGQSYRDETVRNGKLDAYGIDEFGNVDVNRTTSEGLLPPLTTSAQAEGAIEGVHKDYKLSSLWSSDFKFSKFDGAIVKPTGKVSKRMSSTSEYDGDAKRWASRWVGRKHEL